jgi:hypothetical protein
MLIAAGFACRDAIFAAGLARVAEYLNSSRDATTCLICLGTIKPAEAVWQCYGACHAILHLPCVQVSGSSSSTTTTSTSTDSSPQQQLQHHAMCRPVFSSY